MGERGRHESPVPRAVRALELQGQKILKRGKIMMPQVILSLITLSLNLTMLKLLIFVEIRIN